MANYYIKDGELYHHGVKGMKWGVRRTRAQLGYKDSPKRKKTLTPEEEMMLKLKRAGKKLKKGAGDVYDRFKEKRKEKRVKKGHLDELSDEELEKRLKRLQNEKQAVDLQNQIKNAKAQQMSDGAKFVRDFGERAVKSAMIDVGKTTITKLLTKTVGEKIGLDSELIKTSGDMLADLAKEAGHNKQIFEASAAEARAREAKTKADQAEYNFRKQRESDVDKKIDDLISEYAKRSSSSESAQSASDGRDFVQNSGLLALPAPRDDD